MLRLLIDVGNSRIKWRSADTELLGVTSAVARDGDELPAELIAAWQLLASPAAVRAVSVAGEAFDRRLAQWVNRQWGVELQFVRPAQRAYGVSTCYREPQKLGADRWVALVAARDAAPAIVIDCGTALTIDVLTAQREHVGGLIMPGLNLMRASLLERAPGIRAGALQQGEAMNGSVGRDTLTGVQQGTLHAIVGAVKHSVALIESEQGRMTRWITGGDGALIQAQLGADYHLMPDLVLRGLLRMALEE